jgi:hypothetical protein
MDGIVGVVGMKGPENRNICNKVSKYWQIRRSFKV